MSLYSIVYCGLSAVLYLILFEVFGDSDTDLISVVLVVALCYLPCLSLLDFFGLSRDDRPLRGAIKKVVACFGLSFVAKTLIVYLGEVYYLGVFFVLMIVEYLFSYILVFFLLTKSRKG